MWGICRASFENHPQEKRESGISPKEIQREKKGPDEEKV